MYTTTTLSAKGERKKKRGEKSNVYLTKKPAKGEKISTSLHSTETTPTNRKGEKRKRLLKVMKEKM